MKLNEAPTKEVLVVQLVGCYKQSDIEMTRERIQHQIEKGNVVVLDGYQNAIGIFRGPADKMIVEVVNGDFEPIAPVGWR